MLVFNQTNYNHYYGKAFSEQLYLKLSGRGPEGKLFFSGQKHPSAAFFCAINYLKKQQRKRSSAKRTIIYCHYTVSINKTQFVLRMLHSIKFNYKQIKNMTQFFKTL